MCVCVEEVYAERETDSVCVYVCGRGVEGERVFVCVCVEEGHRERVCV